LRPEFRVFAFPQFRDLGSRAVAIPD
jgi:hypothetical protein